ncbi:recombinase family protein [Streptomyces sp. ACT015]|uniref:recombinase family protein n=1 Tax=Streptomyces sp. ACT015 TaxID=3134807 RepID=UPI003D17BB39
MTSPKPQETPAPDRGNWTPSELAELARWQELQTTLPTDASRGLISVRLSVFKDETTSPVRQELDLWALATQRGIRVVGVAADLNQSATKIPPWKRKALGYWLNEKAPEFDVILFWKLDRFIRRFYDLHLMIEWCKEFGKNMISKIEELDFESTFGLMMVTIIAGMARIEAENLGIRLASLWQYARTTERWVVGKPVFGYHTVKNPKTKEVSLAITPDRSVMLRWARMMRVKRKRSYGFICKALNRAGFRTAQGKLWRVTTLVRIMRNPALMGIRVISDGKPGRYNPPRIFYGSDGKPVQVADPIYTELEYTELIEFDASKAQVHTPKKKKSTSFLHVIKCGYCLGNMTYQGNKTKLKNGETRLNEYIRCFSTVTKPCDHRPSTSPDDAYGSLIQAVLDEIGDYEVIERFYYKGEETAKRRKELEESIKFYVEGLAPGGQFAVGGFLQRTAEEAVQKHNAELAGLPEEASTDRWSYKRLEGTYRQRWLMGDTERMEEDLRRGGIMFFIYDEHAKLVIPEDVQSRLVLRDNYFSEERIRELRTRK